jgi:hypothetical protein
MINISLFTNLPKSWIGAGTNHENEAFTATLEIEHLIGRKAVKIDYVATRIDGKHLHRETGVLSSDHTGQLCLWPVMEELPFVLPHRANQVFQEGDDWSITFSTGEEGKSVSFQEEIVIRRTKDGKLGYEHGWGMPGRAFGPKSMCLLDVRTC